ncbi:MAG TPA: hypothetical protein VF623_06860 [Segetibacter sp.]|jgi:hypothetical protein
MFRLLLFGFLLLQTVKMVAQSNANDTKDSTIIKPGTYDYAISQAANSLGKGELEEAKTYYKQASDLKSGDWYSVKMIKYIDGKIWDAKEKQNKEESLKKKAEINLLMSKALDAIAQKEYDSARSFYNQVLTLNPVKSQEEFARKKIEVIDMVTGVAERRTLQAATATNNALSAQKAANPAKQNAQATLAKTATKDLPPEKKSAVTQNLPASAANTKTEAGNLPTVKKTAALQKQNLIAATPKAANKTIQPTQKAVETTKQNLPKPAAKATPGLIQTQKAPVADVNNKANVDQLMNDAAKAIKVNDLDGARILYSRLLGMNIRSGLKEFAKMMIEVIDEESKKNKKLSVKKRA